MTHKPEVEEFIHWAERVRRSQHTLRRYRTVLDQFTDPAHATREEVEAWWATRSGLAPASQENELACLRSFYKWATRFDIRPDDPTRRIDPPKVDNAYPRPIGRTELAQAFDLCDERDAPDLRRALSLGAYGGLRVSEAAALTWKGVDLEKRMLRVRGKGSKERLAALSPRLLDELLPDLEQDVNVVTGTRKAYSADTLQRRINRLLATVNEGLTFHKLRARYVTQAIADTGDIFNVAKAVGWASIETAQHYAEVSNDALHRIAAAASR